MHNVAALSGGDPRRMVSHSRENLHSFGSKVYYKMMLEESNAKGRNIEATGVDGAIFG